MFDEAGGAPGGADDTNATPPDTPGGPEDIARLFAGQDAPPDPPPGEGGTKDERPADPPEEYIANRVPKQFYREDGNHDYDGLVKSWFDTRKDRDGLASKVKALESAAEGPGEWDSYAAQMDWDAVRQSAPKAWLPKEGEENPVAVAMLRRMHEAGIPIAQAKPAIEKWWTDLEAVHPERKSVEDRRKEAVAHLGPNGAQSFQEIQNAIKTHAARRSWKEDERDVLAWMLTSGPALSVLQQLTGRSGGSAAPPTSEHRTEETKEQLQDRVKKRMQEERWSVLKDDPGFMHDVERAGLYEAVV